MRIKIYTWATVFTYHDMPSEQLGIFWQRRDGSHCGTSYNVVMRAEIMRSCVDKSNIGNG